MSNDPTFWNNQLTNAKDIANAYAAAILALTVGGAQSYTLDTGQSRQTVTKFDLDDLRVSYDAALNLVATLEARLNGCGVGIVRPAGC